MKVTACTGRQGVAESSAATVGLAGTPYLQSSRNEHDRRHESTEATLARADRRYSQVRQQEVFNGLARASTRHRNRSDLGNTLHIISARSSSSDLVEFADLQRILILARTLGRDDTDGNESSIQFEFLNSVSTYVVHRMTKIGDRCFDSARPKLLVQLCRATDSPSRRKSRARPILSVEALAWALGNPSLAVQGHAWVTLKTACGWRPRRLRLMTRAAAYAINDSSMEYANHRSAAWSNAVGLSDDWESGADELWEAAKLL